MTLSNLTIQREYPNFPLPHSARAPEGAFRPAGSFEPTAYPRLAHAVPPGIHRSGRYLVRFAQDLEDLRAVQALRFRIFNLELSEGLLASYETGLDSDEFNLSCHHLMVIEHATNSLVGTYRLMTSELGGREDLYTATEFDLSSIPDSVIERGAEVGRACVAKEHRNGRVLQLLWRGIARYLDWNDKRYVFGCCSVPTLEASEIATVSRQLAEGNHFHPRYQAGVLAALRAPRSEAAASAEDAELPPLFNSYLRLGAKVCGGPALDREFGVTDYLVVLDLRDVEPRMLANLAAPGLWQSPAA
ncbi:MAG: GNAT family N-acyltransferase [Myxococcales bacterium]